MRAGFFKLLVVAVILAAFGFGPSRAAGQTYVSLVDFNDNDGGFTVVSTNNPPHPWTWDSASGSWSCYDTADCLTAPRSSRLNSPILTVTNSGLLTLNFVHRYSWEDDGSTRWDGGALRISVNGGAYTNVPDACFTANGYNNTVGGASAPTSELLNQRAFTGTSTGYATPSFIITELNLGPFSVNDTIAIQFLAAWDDCSEGQEPNWQIDSVLFDPPLEDRRSAPVFTDLTQPADTTIMQGLSGTLQVFVFGVPVPTLQWYKDNLLVSGQTNSTYSIPFATPGVDNGLYYVIANNSQGSATSRVANVTVTVDNIAPQFVYGALLQDGTIRIVWNEVMSNFVDGFSVFVYDPNAGGQYVGVQNTPGLQTDRATFLLTPDTNLTMGINYEIFIGSGGFRDQFGNDSPDEGGIGGIVRQLGSEIAIASYSTPWKYFYSTDPVANELITNQPPSARFYSTAFDDSAWSSGLPPFGTETTLPDGLVIATPVPTLPITTYYRLHFFLDRASDVRTANLARVLYDDGFVVYLNGVEMGRSGVATGQDSLTTGASHEASAYSGQAWTIPTDLLVDGENIIAVELHNVNTTSSDNVWAAEVRGVVNTVVLRAPEVESQTLGPINLAERDPLTLTVVATGSQPLHYQWKLGPNPVADATNATYHVPSVTTANAGTYVLSITNLAGSVNSTSIVVNVTPDTVRPTVVSALAQLDPTTISINFSEPITASTATNVANYTVELRGGGSPLAVVSATLNRGTNVVLVTDPRLTDNYQVTIRNLTDLAAAQNLINPNPTVVNLPTEVLLADYTTIGQWTYNDTTESAAPAGWNLRSVTPSGWKTGSPLFYGKRGTPGATSIPTMTTLNLSNAAITAQITSVYFRVSINLSAAQVANTPIKFQYILDDGAVFYVNDTEVLRTGMPTGTIGNQTFANRTVGNDQLWEDPVAISPNTFAAGANLVAVEVHQVTATSSDLAFALQVVGTQSTIVPPLRITGISLNAQNQVILTHNGVSAGQTVYVQETGVLAANPANTVWTTRSGGPHASPYNAGAATGTRFFRLKNAP
jgi:hypothetical protein